MANLQVMFKCVLQAKFDLRKYGLAQVLKIVQVWKRKILVNRTREWQVGLAVAHLVCSTAASLVILGEWGGGAAKHGLAMLRAKNGLCSKFASAWRLFGQGYLQSSRAHEMVYQRPNA